jgi:hypothetical protein
MFRVTRLSGSRPAASWLSVRVPGRAKGDRMRVVLYRLMFLFTTVTSALMFGF